MATRYKLTLSPPTDSDPPTAPIWTVDDVIAVNPPFQNAPALVTVFQFLSPEQRADVVARTLLLDCSAAIQAAIDYVAGNAGLNPIGILWFPAGWYRIETKLTVTTPMKLIGAGQGGEWTTPNTQLSWFGASDDMLQFGTPSGGLPMHGGGIESMALDARSIATRCLLIKDARFFEFDGLMLNQATTSSLELTNTNTQPNPTGLGIIRNVLAQQYNSAANCIRITAAAPATGAAGSTLTTWENIFCLHGSAAALLVTGGDAHNWTKFFANWDGTGSNPPGIWFAGTDPTIPQNAHMFFGCVATAGVQCDNPGTPNIGHVFVNFDDGDLFPGVVPFFGQGVGQISATTEFGRRYGYEKTLGIYETIRHDSMAFIAWNTPLLNTAQGNWGTSADVVADAGQSGGAVNLANDGSAGNIAAIYSCATPGASGISTQYNPKLVFVVSPIDVFNTIHRWGYMDSITDPPTNGFWVEIDNTAHPNTYRLGMTAASVATYYPILNSDGNPLFFGPGQITTWRFDVSPGAVCVYFRVSPFATWVFAGRFTTGMPDVTAKLDKTFWLKGTDSSVRNVFIYDVKEGFNTEAP